MEEKDEDFDDIIEEWEDIPVVEIKVEVERDDEILSSIPNRDQSRSEDLDFESLPEVWKPFVRCHYHQRERLEGIMRKWKWHYQQLMERCSKVVGRKVRDSGEMSFGEAERCIEKLE